MSTSAARRRRRWRRTRVVLAALLGVVVVLAGGLYVGYRAGANESPVRLVQRLFGGEDELTAGGRRLTGRESYLNNCAACHGPNGEGGRLRIKGPAFTPGGALSGLTFDERVAKIARGRPLNGMPAWKFRISDDEIRRVAAYTQTLSGHEPQPGVEDVR